VKVGAVEAPVRTFQFGPDNFEHDNVYFGDWVSLRNAFNKIIGFKIVPFVKDDYLEKNVLSARFINHATNVSLDKKGDYYYISVLIEPSAYITEYDMNKIEAAILLNHKDDFIIRLDGFSEQDWEQFSFTPASL
jgi:hypothetical protein